MTLPPTETSQTASRSTCWAASRTRELIGRFFRIDLDLSFRLIHFVFHLLVIVIVFVVGRFGVVHPLR